MENKIPKTIHYCWFGKGKKPKLVQKCMKSWRKFCPDYKIIEWNELNFPINQFPYAQEAYNAKKWAFVSDVARFWAIHKYGGIYLDTDEEVIKKLDIFLKHEAFVGFENEINLQAGILGGIKNHWWFKELLKYYSGERFKNNDGTLNMRTIVGIITDISITHGLQKDNSRQTIKNLEIYPREVFCPEHSIYGDIKIDNTTYTVHHYAASWVDTRVSIKRKIQRYIILAIHFIIGQKNYKKLHKLLLNRQ